MTAGLSSLLDNPYVVFTGWTLLVVLWETTLVGLLLAAWRVRHAFAPAGQQYRAAVVALIAAMALAVAIPFVLLSVPARSSAPQTMPSTSRTGGTVTPQSPARSASAISRQASLRGTAIVSLDRAAAIAVIAWAAGIFILTVRLIGGWYVAHSLARRAHAAEASAFGDAAERLRAELRLHVAPRIVQSPEVEAPVVIGWRRPTLVVPPDAAAVSPEMATALLAHELAHIERRDYLANLVQSAIELLLFFSPAVLWMSRRIREAREFCCDDVAVARCGDARQYVQALTTLAALAAMNTMRPAMSAAGPRLIVRARRLLQEEPMPRFTSMRMVALSAVLVAVVASGVRVSVASAARAPRARPSVGAAAQDRVPFGYAPTQQGSGVVMQNIVSTADAPAERATIRNVSTETIVGLQFVAAVEHQRGPRQPVRLFVSNTITVSIPPGQSADVSPSVLTAAQLQELAASAPEGRLQYFLGLQSVEFANGFEWSVQPNAAALNGADALNIERVYLSRDLIARDANRPQVPFAPCRDERNRATSHGGLVPIVNEPGHFLRCDNGRWVESAGR
jgi:beta-lactamase regulating signal transducer with metallopeptidase domain